MAQLRASFERSARDDADALAEILPRAASPAERACGGWIEPVDDRRADERLEAWASSVADGRVDDLKRLLTQRGIEDGALTRMLSDAGLASPQYGARRPAWAEAVIRLVAAGRRVAVAPPALGAADVVNVETLPPGTPAGARWRFDAVSTLWIGAAAELLDREVAETPFRVDASARTGLLGGLAQRWHEILVRPLLDPLGPADVIRSVPLRDGDTVEAAYLGAAATVDDWLRLWIAYPVAARLMALSFERWHANVRELLSRLVRDEARLAATFGRGAERLGDLRSARWAGDPHDGHRRVALLAFASGLKVVYKPRPLDPDRWYADAYSELTGDRYDSCSRILVRPGYGWQELVAETDCAGEQELRTYFRRIGAHARVLELLDAVDAHGENVIAVDERPTLVDMETLLTPRSMNGDGENAFVDFEAASPLRSALITVKARGTPGSAAVELGALAAPGWETSPWPIPIPDPATGAVALGPGRFPVATALPRLAGQHMLPDAYEDDIIAGYLDADRAMRRRASGWLRDGAAAAAGQLRTRFVFRETRTYARVLVASLSAAALRDGVARELVLEVLWRRGLPSKPPAPPPALVEAEVSALRDLDIPLFRSAPGTRELLLSHDRIPGYFTNSPLGILEQRVLRLGSEPDDGSAADAVRLALFVRNPALRRRGGGRHGADASVLGEHLLALCRKDSSGAAAWFGLRYEAAFACWSPGLLGPDLATGTSGIAAVLSDLSRHTGARRAATVAAATVACASKLLAAADRHPHPAVPKLSSSLAGTVYGLHRAASQLGVDVAPVEEAAAGNLSETADPALAAIWLVALSGCRIASPRLNKRLLDLAWIVHDRLGELAAPEVSYARVTEERYADLTPFAAALAGLQRVASQSDRALAPPAELLADACRSEALLNSLATHAILATGGMAPSLLALLRHAVAEHRPPPDLPPLERGEHALARAWVGCEPESVACATAATAIEDWSAESRAPVRFDLGALGGLAGACHLALRMRAPRQFPPLRTCAPSRVPRLMSGPRTL